MHPSIDLINFTPISALLGGALIGIAASILVIFRGKIAGISGIVGGMLQTQNTPKDHFLWRGLFLIGLMGSNFVYRLFFPWPELTINASLGTLLFAGLLVGFGTRMGAGCTSGHGVCGLSRLSLRSLLATLSFMFSGFVTCYLFLHAI